MLMFVIKRNQTKTSFLNLRNLFFSSVCYFISHTVKKWWDYSYGSHARCSCHVSVLFRVYGIALTEESLQGCHNTGTNA